MVAVASGSVGIGSVSVGADVVTTLDGKMIGAAYSSGIGVGSHAGHVRVGVTGFLPIITNEN